MLHGALMFTGSLSATDDTIAQHHLLNRIAGMVECGVLRTTLGEHDDRTTVDNLRCAHAAQESHRTRGKPVLEGF
ncbi:zinc-binding dehydrogenase [Xanthomonas campestris pv. incanae]|nr:zinc-binding dehydrogenase [Xanthomonas campestris]WDJ93914.1 zinc-binding dehydrogenase [Xanthomonas campestris pv. incanae]